MSAPPYLEHSGGGDKNILTTDALTWPKRKLSEKSCHLFLFAGLY